MSARFKHNAWIYAFRFLRVLLSSQMSNSGHEHAPALQHIKAIQQLAKPLGDDSVYVTSATLEAILHLNSGSSESVEQAQRAIAAARRYQLKPSVEGTIDQIWALLDCIDLACGLLQYSPDYATQKVESIQKLLDDQSQKASEWADDGSLLLPLNKTYDPSTTNESNGAFCRTASGQDMLSLSWLSRRDLYCLGYHMSGLVAQLKSNAEKAQTYFRGGLKMLDGKSLDS